MATTKKTTKKTTTKKPVIEETEKPVVEEPVIEEEKPVIKENIIQPKAKVGEIVYVSKDADADLEGFNLFPEYKNCTYTVEAYDANTDVYTLRRLNLLLHLKGEHVVHPEEKAHDKLNRIQF